MTRPTHRRRRSGRVRALLSLGLLLGISQVGTLASWTDSATIGGSNLTSATLDIKANNQDNYSSITLSMSAMVPGSTSAEVITIKNAGTAPLKYTLTGGLTGTDASSYNTAAANGLLLTIRAGGTLSGSTCNGGMVVFTEAPLTSTTATTLLPTRPAIALVPNGTESLCFQIRLAITAPTTLQGKTTTATFAANATSDVS
jgi:predicted ribosomally synthesized peptide with SipW-like signal peptide